MGLRRRFDEEPRARERLLRERPMLLVGSPMCTAFSTWQRINNKIRDPEAVKGEIKGAKQHLEFCVELYREQAKAGRYVLHEHAAYASSWQTDSMESIMKDEGLVKTTADLCQYEAQMNTATRSRSPPVS